MITAHYKLCKLGTLLSPGHHVLQMPVITPVTHIAKKNDRHQNYEGAQHGNYLNCDAENAKKKKIQKMKSLQVHTTIQY